MDTKKSGDEKVPFYIHIEHVFPLFILFSSFHLSFYRGVATYLLFLMTVENEKKK